jgi:hypothetical protein
MAELTDSFLFSNFGTAARWATDITSLTVTTGTNADGIGSPASVSAVPVAR